MNMNKLIKNLSSLTREFSYEVVLITMAICKAELDISCDTNLNTDVYDVLRDNAYNQPASIVRRVRL